MRFDFYYQIQTVDVNTESNSVNINWRITSKLNVQRSSELLLSELVDRRKIKVALSKELAVLVEEKVKGSGSPESAPDSYTTVFPLD
jgi:hypothetical protein